jgi:precorrin-4/cobalt-precorrin-4 C11-methyltransferase
MNHPVVFCGAGPGDPDLITVKGQQALAEADVVVYAGSLVPRAVLKWARPGAALQNSAAMHLQEIVGQMAAAYQAHQRVVRLHTGDPSLYGAIFEQMAELDRRGIPYRVIPGVTAAFAAAAAMGIEYTLPEISQTLILTRMAGRTPVPQQEALESLAAHQASMAIYLSISLIAQVAEILSRTYGPQAPCALAFRVSQPEEKIRFTRVERLVELVKQEGIDHQALIIVGKVLGVRPPELKHRSKLYDPDFNHAFRRPPGADDLAAAGKKPATRAGCKPENLSGAGDPPPPETPDPTP